ncbi:MAG TPA: alpha/beta family hydrolase [Acidimicrobiales bacterium]|nr:alpha/beta family hydrolase [Acidimicrobiales bacterium]
MTPDRALLLAPGAGASRDHSTLVAIEEALEPVVTRRMDFPYRKAGRKSPDRPEVLVAAVREEATALASDTALAPDRLVLGGRSLGGRMCSMAVAEGLPALGLALVSYPLHPPGRPERLRIDHFELIGVPCLFVAGTRDAFGTVEELDAAIGRIEAPVTTVWLEGGDHGLRRRDADVAEAVRDWVLGLP